MYLLVADDNPLSLRFFAEAMHQLGHHGVTAADGAQALAHATAENFDAIVLDVHMPLLSGPRVLQRLRADTDAASHASAAIATTADQDGRLHDDLLAQGFHGVLAKPLSLASFASALDHIAAAARPQPSATRRAAGGSATPGELRLLDDRMAVQALGDLAIVTTLRSLFAGELAALPAELDALLQSGDIAALRDRLHRLRASCGFCGAARLDLACQQLRSQLDHARAVPGDQLAILRRTAAATLSALAD